MLQQRDASRKVHSLSYYHTRYLQILDMALRVPHFNHISSPRHLLRDERALKEECPFLDLLLPIYANA